MNGQQMTLSHDVNWTNLESQLGEERQKVDVSSHDFSVRELVRMLVEGELSITPEYQRQYRWKSSVASTFVESIFLGLPVPPIFVATNENFELEVVDGLQRLSSLLFFMADDQTVLAKVTSDPNGLKLEGLEKLTQLNGIRHGELPTSLQRYFGRQPLQVISLTDKSNKNVRFDLFERLNAGSVTLSPQEVRACVYRGDFNRYIEGLSILDEYNQLLKLQEAKTKDGTAVEEVLKFFAYKNSASTFDGKVKIFLNDYMEEAQKTFDYSREEGVFRTAVAYLLEATGGQPLLRSSTSVTPLVQLEACLVGLGRLIENGAKQVVIPAQGWQEDAELVEASTGATNTRSKLTRRIARAEALFSD